MAVGVILLISIHFLFAIRSLTIFPRKLTRLQENLPTKILNHPLPALLIIAGIGFASTASASLETRPGGMVYDTDLNITWLVDANYSFMLAGVEF